jgi:hypothetical protein
VREAWSSGEAAVDKERTKAQRIERERERERKERIPSSKTQTYVCLRVRMRRVDEKRRREEGTKV